MKMYLNSLDKVTQKRSRERGGIGYKKVKEGEKGVQNDD
jgi:hypothetical protein